jgi:hypothetical protein
LNNLKQISQAVAHLSGLNAGKCPPGYGTYSAEAGSERSFFYWILPGIEQDTVYKNQTYQAFISTYAAPADATNPFSDGRNSYCVNGRVFGGYCPNGPVATFPGTFDLKGASHTVVVFERYARLNGNWSGGPADNADGSCILHGPHTDVGGAVKDPTFGLPDTDPNCTLTANGYSASGVQVALADGSARTVTPSMTASPSPAIGTSIWGWAISVTGPARGKFGKATRVPSGW